MVKTGVFTSKLTIKVGPTLVCERRRTRKLNQSKASWMPSRDRGKVADDKASQTDFENQNAGLLTLPSASSVPLPVSRESHDRSFASSTKIEQQSLDPRTAWLTAIRLLCSVLPLATGR
jgi:hypothetical protein